jgi:hypothetical protein
MNCDEIRGRLSLLLYGELPFAEEEAVESHLDSCQECMAALDAERSLHSALDQSELEPSAALLRESRLAVSAAIVAGGARANWWERLRANFIVPSLGRPLGALALIAMGFLGARFTPFGNVTGVGSAAMFDPNTARVRYVEPGPGGEIQMVVDETRQRVVSGHLGDAHIRGLLLAAVKDPTDPGLRVESVEILKSQSGISDVRTALVAALQHDPNAGVRLKALDGLKRYASYPDVRKALAQALLTDDNPGIRTQAIDLLMSANQESHLVGVFQELMRKEDNDYIRLRCEKALHALKASTETY